MEQHRFNKVLEAIKAGGTPQLVGQSLSTEQVEAVGALIEQRKAMMDEYFTNCIATRLAP
jgi:hypothetical protein